MKVNTNFVAPRHQLALPLAGGTAVLAILMAALSAGFVVDSITKRSEKPVLEQQLATLSQRTASLTPVSLPSGRELSDLKRRVRAINSLSPQRGAPLTHILSRLEALLPEKVWLASLHYRAREGELVFIVEAESVEPFTQLLQKLERDPLFEGILLSKQTPQDAHGRSVVQSELRLRR